MGAPPETKSRPRNKLSGSRAGWQPRLVKGRRDLPKEANSRRKRKGPRQARLGLLDTIFRQRDLPW